MLRVLIVVAVLVVVVVVLNLAFPEKRTIILRNDIYDYQVGPSDLLQALNDGWTISGGDNRRIFTLERPRLRLP